MRTALYFIIGIVFGITMFKSEAASWFRIYEMFQFKSFHMYGIIGAGFEEAKTLIFNAQDAMKGLNEKAHQNHKDTLRILRKIKYH